MYKTQSFPGLNPEGQGAAAGGLLYTHMGMLSMLPNGSLAAAWQVNLLLHSIFPYLLS